ncbi:MAG: SRPBCC domain-containing protein [Flavobacteriales bacterium]|jgi:activator of HSP90 ATPase|nr:SRPBCC domain-containing protein [Flavobacteriales bacterium]
MTQFKLQDTFNATAQEIYEAWLNGDKHTAMTGGEATGEATVGSEFTAWDGYISGVNLELETNKRIVQEWRTTEFSDDQASSKIEVLLEEKENKTVLTLIHTNIPDGQSDYETGWNDHYFEPMKHYFG